MAQLIRKLAIAAIILGVGFISTAMAQGPKDSIVQAPFVPGEVLVRFKPGVSVTAQMQTHAGISPGVRIMERFDSIVPGLQRVQLPSNLDVFQAIRIYQRNTDVLYAEPNYIVRKAQQIQLTPNDTQFNSLYGLHNTGQTGGTIDADIDAPEAWDWSTGSSSVVVFVIDTGGDYNHEDLITNRWVNPNETPGNNIDDDGNGYIDDIYGIDTAYNDTNPMDGDGHGTHVSGTIGSPTTLTSGDVEGILMVSVQTLYELSLEKDKKIEQLTNQLEELQRRMEQLERLVQELSAKK